MNLIILIVLATLTLSAGGQNGAAIVEREIHAMEDQWNEARAKADVEPDPRRRLDGHSQ